MNVVSRKPMGMAEFLAWEERQALRYEFDGAEIVDRTGGTAAHSAIQVNLIAALRARRCQVYGSGLKIEVAGSIRYPDAFVTCAPVAPKDTVVREPVVVFEVLSESTANTELIEKNAEYRANAVGPALRHPRAGPRRGDRVRAQGGGLGGGHRCWRGGGAADAGDWSRGGVDRVI